MYVCCVGVWVGDYPYVQRPKFRSFVDNALLDDTDNRGHADAEEREGGGVVSVSAVGRSSSSGKRGGSRSSSSSRGASSSSSSSNGGGTGSSSRSSSSSSKSTVSGSSSSRSPDKNASFVVDSPTPLQRRARIGERAGTPLQARYSARESTSARASANKRQEDRSSEGEATDIYDDDGGGDMDMYDGDFDPLQNVQAWLDDNTNPGDLIFTHF